jgi:hypothetical protein
MSEKHQKGPFFNLAEGLAKPIKAFRQALLYGIKIAKIYGKILVRNF